jgi:hypothetical protein
VTTERPSFAHLKCGVCRQWKHRQSFKPRDSPSHVYDDVCTACRPKRMSTKTDLVVLHKRVLKKVLTPEKHEEILRQKKQNSIEGVRAGMHRYHLRQRMKSWEAPHKSARIALRTLNQFRVPEGCEAWMVTMYGMVRDALKKIKENKRNEMLAADGLVFWYDVLEGGAVYVRRHIRSYPLGADNAPLQVF